jgi:MSHA biogenesis protein MshQ
MNAISNLTSRQFMRLTLTLPALLLLSMLIAPAAVASPCDDGDYIYCEDFDDFPESTGPPPGWTLAAGPVDRVGVGSQTANSNPHSMFQRGNNVRVESPVIDLAGETDAILTFWVSRGHNTQTTPDEDVPLNVEYRDANGNWQALDQIPGGTDVREFFRVHQLPAAALHAGFQLSFQHPAGGCRSGGTYICYWHVDDITIGQPSNVELLVFGQPDQWFVNEGDTAEFQADAFACDESHGQWRDSWNFGDGNQEQSLHADSPCSRSPILEDHVYNTIGDYTVRFTSEYCADWSGSSCLSGWQEHGSDTVLVIVEEDVDAELLLHYRFEQAEWDGSAGEVRDRSVNQFHANAIGGANTALEEPAIDGDPGTCRYADLRDSGRLWRDVPNALNQADEFSVAFWLRQGDDRDASIVAAGGIQGDLYAERFEILQRSNGDFRLLIRYANGNTVFLDVPPGTVFNNEWNHVAVTRHYEFDHPRIYVYERVYINGNQAAQRTANVHQNNANQLDLSNTSGELQLGGFRDGNFPAHVRMDEFRLYQGGLTAAEVQAVMNRTWDCRFGPDAYEVVHGGSMVSCAADTVTITGITLDNDGNPSGTEAPDAGTILTLATDTGRGAWSAVLAGSGSLNNLGGGMGEYVFPGDEASVSLAFNYTGPAADPESVIISVIDDEDAEGSSDPLTVRRTGFRFQESPGGPAGIPGQIAGKPSDQAYGASDVMIQAIRTSDENPTVCEGQFSDGQTVAVEFAAECRDPFSCAGESLSVAGNPVATHDDFGGDPLNAPGWSAVTLEFDGNSAAPIPLNYFDAGETRLHARYEIPRADDEPGEGSPSGDFMLGSSGGFVWRPFGFEVRAPGDAGEPPASNGSVLVAAGEDFAVELRAVAWSPGQDGSGDGNPDPGVDLSGNATTPNFGNESVAPVVQLSPQVAAPAGGEDGTLSNASIDGFAAGEASRSDLRWSEVGYVHLDAEQSNYLGTGPVIGSGRNIGRFIPHHYQVTTLADPDLAAGCTAGDPFNYLTQPMAWPSNDGPRIQITAVNAGGVQTRNARDDYWRFDELSDYDFPQGANFRYRDDGLPEDHEDDLAINASLVDLLDGILSDAVEGQSEVQLGGSLGHQWDHDPGEAPMVESFASELFVRILIRDLDDVEYENESGWYELELPVADDAEQRHGRLDIGNAHGSELLDLAGRVVTQYFYDTDTGWIVNTADSCTDGIALEVTPDSASVATCIIEPGDESGAGCNAGEGGKNWQEPPANGDFNAWFQFTNDVGSHDVTPTSIPAWLEFDWAGDGDGHDQMPQGTITFGIYSGQDRRIDLRETW